MENITKKLTIGAIWNTLSQFGSQLINFIIILILASLLTPRDFGLVGMVSVITSFMGYFTEFGLTPSLIQKKKIDKIDENTVFWATWGFAICIYLIVYFMAPLVADFYNDPQLTRITRILFISFLFAPIAFVPETLEIKGLNYNKIAVANLLADSIAGVTAIVMAVMGFGVWSLVFQILVRPLVRGCYFIKISAWRPKFLFSFQRFRNLLGFGVQFTLKNLLQYLTENIDYLLVGKILGAHALGIYTLAFRISKYPVKKVWGILGQMLFPAFSSFNDDYGRLKMNYIKTTVLTCAVLIPALACIFWGVDSFTIVFLKEKWSDIIPIVKIFVLYLIVFSLLIPDDPLLAAIGKIKLVNINKLFFLILLVSLGCYGTIQFGLNGMAWAYVFSYVVSGSMLKYTTMTNFSLNLSEIVKPLKKSFFIGLASWFGCMGIFKFTGTGILELLLMGSFVAGVTVAVFCYLGVIDVRTRKICLEKLL